MRIVKRIVDPSSFNLEFYEDTRICENMYHGTLKLSSHSKEASELVAWLKELPFVRFESVNYLLMTKAASEAMK